ncbi:MAG: hypothetical protein ACSW8G_03040 [Bacillota bacterium]
MFINIKRPVAVVLAVFIAPLIVLICGITQTAYADESSRWDDICNTTDIKEIEYRGDKTVYLEKTKLDFNCTIDAFDVSEEKIAVVFCESRRDTLGIFDNNFRLISSFEMTDFPGRTSGIAIHGDNVVLFPGDAQFATEITTDGEYVCMYKVSNKDSGTAMHLTTRTIEKVGNDTYYVNSRKEMPGGDWGSFDEPYLIKENAAGEKTILFDSHKWYEKGLLRFFSIFGLFLALWAVGAYFQHVKPYRKKMKTLKEQNCPEGNNYKNTTRL